MRITKLAVKSFGRHDAATWDTDAPVVMIIGPNGAGKSTILAAVKIGLVGEGVGKDPLVSYVKDVTGEDAPKFGETTLDFRKQSLEGSISRRISKATGQTTRKLIWDGVTYTKAAEVDTLLADMFGASKRALSNVVFIAQGELDKILFGKQAEREVMFLRLLMIDHLENVAAESDRQIKILSSGLADHSIALDEIHAQRRNLSGQLQEISGKLAATRDWSEDIITVRNYLAARYNATVDLPGQHAAAAQELHRLTEAHRSALHLKDVQSQCSPTLLAHYPRLMDDDPAELAGVLDNLREDARAIEAYSNWGTQRSYAAQRLMNLEADQADLKARLDVLEPLVSGTMTGQADDIVLISAQVKASYDLETTRKELDNAQLRLTAMELALDGGEKRQKELDTHERPIIDENREKVKAVAQLLADARQILQLQQAVAKLVPGAVTCCPLCRQNVDHMEIDEATIEASRKTVNDLQARYDTTVSDINTFEREYAGLVGNILTVRNNTGICRGEIDNLTRKIGELQGFIPEGFDRDKALARHGELSEQIRQFQGNKQEKEKLEKQLNGVLQNWLKAGNDVRALDAAVPDCPEKFGGDLGAGVLPHIKSAINLLTPKFNIIRDTTIRLESQKGVIADVNRRIKNATDELKEHEHRLLLGGNALAELIDNLDTEAVTALQERQNARQQLQGELRSMEAQERGLLARQRDIEQKIEKNKLKQIVIDELKLLKEAFTRTGLPMLYVNHKFKQLVEITQAYLTQMGSAFMIRPGEEPLNLEFQRLDEVDAPWLSQSKLSGGQRVRLSVCFIMAVQRLVIPDCGFCTLDEPSTHLDEEGVDALATLLQDIQSKLANADFQMLVCDHHPKLQQVSGKSIKLT